MLWLVGCDEDSVDYNNIVSISYIHQSAGPGTYEDQIPTEIKIFSDGQLWVVRESKELDFYVVEKFSIDDEAAFKKVVNTFRKEKFHRLPEDLSSFSWDGSFHYVEVETETGVYRKGGLNPRNKRFSNCINAILKEANQFDIPSLSEAVRQYDYEQAYIDRYGKIYDSQDEIYSLFLAIYDLASVKEFKLSSSEVEEILKTEGEFYEYLADDNAYEYYNIYQFKYRYGDEIWGASFHVYFGETIAAFHSGLRFDSEYIGLKKYENTVMRWWYYEEYLKNLGDGILEYFDESEFEVSWEEYLENEKTGKFYTNRVRATFDNYDESMITFFVLVE
jgi:hypothetical protein